MTHTKPCQGVKDESQKMGVIVSLSL